MNNEIRSIKLKNKVKIIESADNSRYIVKKNKKNLKELFLYLENRSFNNFPKVLSVEEDEVRYEYIDEMFIPKEEKYRELIDIVSNLHYKTSYYKEVNKKKYKEIYTRIIENIDYLKEQYTKKITEIESEVYMSPSHYLFARNYKIFNGALEYAEKELNAWYRIVENKTKERVSIIHNNLDSSHYLRGEQGYLISWDNYVVDTPVLDLYKLYMRESFNTDFKSLFEEYNKTFKLTEEEVKLFKILVSLPKRIDDVESEYLNTKNIKNITEYMHRTNNLVFSGVFNVKENKATN